jgi:hypothetical protein
MRSASARPIPRRPTKPAFIYSIGNTDLADDIACVALSGVPLEIGFDLHARISEQTPIAPKGQHVAHATPTFAYPYQSIGERYTVS